MESPREFSHKTPPGFLGIGVPKGGSTWLYELLNSHPDIWVPPQKREVSFFNQESPRAKGLQWYARFFPDKRRGDRYKAVGEITPHYFYMSDERIAYLHRHFKSIKRVLFILRNPVERAYSHYWFRKRVEGYKGTFEEFLETRPESTEWGFYAKYLANWLRYFSRNQMLALILEEAVADVSRGKEAVAAFLGVDATRFPDEAGRRKINERLLPRFPGTYRLACKTMQGLHKVEMYRLANFAKKLRVKTLLESGRRCAPIPAMSITTRTRLERLYAADIARLEQLLEIDLVAWKRPVPPAHAAGPPVA